MKIRDHNMEREAEFNGKVAGDDGLVDFLNGGGHVPRQAGEGWRIEIRPASGRCGQCPCSG